jgi:hypothetical protein
MFGNKFPKLTAAIGRDAHSDQDLIDINAELNEKGLKGVTLIRQGDMTSHDEALDAANKKANDAINQLTIVTKERDDWKEKAEAYGDQPGDVKTAIKKKKDESGEGYQSDPEASYNKRANRAIGNPAD